MSFAEGKAQEGTMQWECLGPIASGGTVFGLAVSPVNSAPDYWAATGCGVFAHDRFKGEWSQKLNGLTSPLLSSIAVAPNGALFAGTLGGDLFASFDFGETWEPGLIPEESRSTVTTIVTSPNFAKDGTVFAGTDGGGLLVSRSSGERWEDSSFGLESDTVLALAATSDWSTREILFAATPDGVFVSRNGGRVWRRVGLSLDDDLVDALAVSPAFEQDRTVFAGTEQGTLHCSRDGGQTWQVVKERLGHGPVNCLWVAPDFPESGLLVAGVGMSVCVSQDAGQTWSVHEMPGTVLALSGNAEFILVGLHNAGIWKSADRGCSWTNVSEGVAARGFARLVGAGDKLYAMGPQEGIYVSTDHGETWDQLQELEAHIPLSGFWVTPCGQLFVTSQEGGILRSTNGGQDWDVVCDYPGIQAICVVPEADRGWAGTEDGRLLVSLDGGATWKEASSPCEGQEILSLVASSTFQQDQTVFMGTSIPATGSKPPRVAIWRSTDGGKSWRQITTQVTDARWVDVSMPVGVSDNVADQAVLATGPFCLRPLRRAKDVWISTRVDPNGANTLGVVAIGEIDKDAVLFAATGNGVYRSLDSGRTWHLVSEGLGQSFIGLTLLPGNCGYALYAMGLGGLLWRFALD